MSASTKIVVLKLKEIIVAAAITLALIIFVILLIVYISSKNKNNLISSETAAFVPGVYTSSIILSGTAMDLEVTVDKSCVKALRLRNTQESMETMYPLLGTSIKDLEKQIVGGTSTYGVTYPSDSKYTSLVLINAINCALNKARIVE